VSVSIVCYRIHKYFSLDLNVPIELLSVTVLGRESESSRWPEHLCCILCCGEIPRYVIISTHRCRYSSYLAFIKRLLCIANFTDYIT